MRNLRAVTGKRKRPGVFLVPSGTRTQRRQRLLWLLAVAGSLRCRPLAPPSVQTGGRVPPDKSCLNNGCSGAVPWPKFICSSLPLSFSFLPVPVQLDVSLLCLLGAKQLRNACVDSGISEKMRVVRTRPRTLALSFSRDERESRVDASAGTLEILGDDSLSERQ